MFLKRFKYCMVVICCLLSVPVLKAQKVWTDEELEKLKSPDLLAGADTLLSFDRDRLDVGVISEDDKPSVYRFTCRNNGKERVVITRLASSCGCTKAEVSHPVIQPGEESVVSLTYNPFGRPGKLYAQVLVYTDRSDKLPVISLSLEGKVTPSAALWKNYRFTVGELKLRRKGVDFGIVKPGQNRVERIACANAGAVPLKISAAKMGLPEYLSVYTNPAVLEPSEEGELVVAVDGNKLPETLQGKKQVTVLLEGVSGIPTERMLKVTFTVCENLTE